jgi:flagellar motor switch protein FliG
MKITSENNFASLVEKVKKISTEDKEELRFLLEKYLIEEKRDNIYKNYQVSLDELKENKINYSGDIDNLREML